MARDLITPIMTISEEMYKTYLVKNVNNGMFKIDNRRKTKHKKIINNITETDPLWIKDYEQALIDLDETI